MIYTKGKSGISEQPDKIDCTILHGIFCASALSRTKIYQFAMLQRDCPRSFYMPDFPFAFGLLNELLLLRKEKWLPGYHNRIVHALRQQGNSLQ